MIEALKASREEIRSHHEMLEERIRRRTEDLQEATRRAETASKVKGESWPTCRTNCARR
jgi:hypothetical protein